MQTISFNGIISPPEHNVHSTDDGRAVYALLKLLYALEVKSADLGSYIKLSGYIDAHRVGPLR